MLSRATTTTTIEMKDDDQSSLGLRIHVLGLGRRESGAGFCENTIATMLHIRVNGAGKRVFETGSKITIATT